MQRAKGNTFLARFNDAVLGRKWQGTGPLGGKFAEQRAIDENEKDIIEKKAERLAVERELEERKERGINLDLRQAEAQAALNYREVRRVKDLKLWYEQYYAAQQKGATEAQAHEAGNLAVFTGHQERLMNMASRLVNARSGAGDIARAASLADPNSELRREMQATRLSIERGNGALLNKRELHTFDR